jgi:hypothetical protein
MVHARESCCSMEEQLNSEGHGEFSNKSGERHRYGDDLGTGKVRTAVSQPEETPAWIDSVSFGARGKTALLFADDTFQGCVACITGEHIHISLLHYL